MTAILAAVLGAVLAASAAAAGSDQDAPAPPVLGAEQTCAAILREDFNGDEWDKASWSTWVQDARLRVYCEADRLRIKGTTGAPSPECADHHDFRFTGLVSKRFPVRSVVLAADMHVLAPLPTGETRVRYLVHLCGATPDYFLDTGLAYEPDGRQGWLFVPIAEGYPFSHDHQFPFVPLEEVAPHGERTIVIDHDDATKRTRGHVVEDGTWHALGDHRVFLATTQVEIKVDVPYDGVDVDVTYENVRMYPRPENAPVRIVVCRPPFPFFPFSGATVTLVDESGDTVAQGTTDQDGEAALMLPSNRLYPLGGTVRISQQGEPIGVAPIESSGVNGLYPGDVWKIRAPDTYRVEGKGYPRGM